MTCFKSLVLCGHFTCFIIFMCMAYSDVSLCKVSVLSCYFIGYLQVIPRGRTIHFPTCTAINIIPFSLITTKSSPHCQFFNARRKATFLAICEYEAHIIYGGEATLVTLDAICSWNAPPSRNSIHHHLIYSPNAHSNLHNTQMIQIFPNSFQ